MSCKPEGTHHNACDCREEHFRKTVRTLEIENEEQARLLGMSGSREAKFLEQLRLADELAKAATVFQYEWYGAGVSGEANDRVLDAIEAYSKARGG